MPDRLQAVLPTTHAPRVLVVGDLILDEFLQGSVQRISPEAPVPVLDSTDTRYALGGAANVAHNLATLGCEVSLCGLVGDDSAGERLIGRLRKRGIDTAAVVVAQGRPTTHKMRVLARNQQVLRIDREERAAPDREAREELAASIDWTLESIDGVVLSDYRKGVLSEGLVDHVIRAATAAKLRVTVDPKGVGYARYAGVEVLTPNVGELAEASGERLDRIDGEAFGRAASVLLEQTQAHALLVTCGRHGMVLCTKAGRRIHIPAEAREVFDVTGAGDTVIATFSMALFAGADLITAARLANTAAGLVVGKLGTATVSRDELAHQLTRQTPHRKIVDRVALGRALEEARSRGHRIVFTNGCFDILHAGHVAFLQAAKARGDLLVVGLNTDASVRRLKGDGRPLVDQDGRAAVLAALDCVTYVTFFEEDTPAQIISEVRPDLLVKGSDWELDQIVGREFVESYGGQVEQIPLVDGYSTSKIVAAAVRSFPPEN